MRINFNAIPKYRIWRNGTNKKTPSRGRPGSKIEKNLLRTSIKSKFRKYRLQQIAGMAHETAKQQRNRLIKAGR